LGVAALEGQGQRGLFRMLAGLAAQVSGTVAIDGQPAHLGSPRQALKSGSGVAYLPEERKTEGILAGLTAATNVVLPILPKSSFAAMISPVAELRAAGPAAAKVEMNPRYLGFAIGDLSGGNQQKALVARTLATGARILLLYDPTRGVDVGTKQSIYAAIRAFAAEGGSVLFYSSELPEVVQLADRCLALYGGRIFQEFVGEAIVEQGLVAAILGHGTSGAELSA
ncbi:MAG: sugar ABC transporter ATP-binding protein, partial [Candidatus Saccharibacteria bacterium]|nr:sugar ABC transporter ATP-binding protein [Pseudorhodobacter sp.]